MINWPDSPTPGQVFNPGTGSIYTWDGVAWNLTPVNVKTARTRNHVINPSMVVSQENGTSQVLTAGTFPVDQWQIAFAGIVAAGQKVTVAPSPEGTVSALGMTATTAKGSLAATDYLLVQTAIEGLDVADLQWGTANAKPIVLRFAAYCEQPGTYSFALSNGAANRSYCGTFTITAAATLQVFSFAIPGDTGGTWLKDTGVGLVLRFAFAIGSTYLGPANSWQAAQYFGATGMTNGAATVKWFAVTDVGIYIDPENTGIAPPFIVPSYEDDLVRCCRYWTYMPVSAQSPVAGYAISSWYTGVPMRVAPTLVVRQAGASNVATIGQDTVTNDRGGLFQISASANGGYVIGRLYGLSARLI